MKIKHLFISILAVPLVFSFAGAFAASDALSIKVVTTFDYPGTGNATISEGINDRGDITGLYTDANGITRGFIRFHAGSFSPPIVEPNDAGNYTAGRGINHARAVDGYYAQSDGTFHGFFLDRGTYTEFDVPGAFNTYVEGLNDTGDFVGADDSTGALQAFRNLAGTTETIAIPDAASSYAFGINRQRATTGQYTSASTGIIHGWYADGAGTVTSFDAPNSSQTLPFGINNKTFVVGRYTDNSTGLETGFVFNTRKGLYVTFEYTDAVFTSLNGINSDGLICGRYQDAAGLIHGLLARVVTGP